MIWLYCLIGICALMVICYFLCHLQAKKLKLVNVCAHEPQSNQRKIRICFISDLHFPNFCVDEKKVIDGCISCNPDLIVIGGDLIQNKKAANQAVSFIQKLSNKTTVPIRIVLGNHDLGKDGFNEPALTEFVKSIEFATENVKVLRNQVDILKTQGNCSRICLVGYTDFKHLSKITALNMFDEAMENLDKNDSIIILEHNPDIVTYLQKSFEKADRTTLVLSGHTHGGQCSLPFNMEFLLLRKDILPKKGYKYGLFDYCKNCKLYISCGIGESFLPIRFGTTPEIAIIDY